MSWLFYSSPPFPSDGHPRRSLISPAASNSRTIAFSDLTDAFRSLGLLTLPCLYILEVALYCRYKCDLTHGSDVYGYNTRGRDNLRFQSHRTMAYEQLPSQVGIKVINRLPECIKELATKKRFKARLRDLLVSNKFYSVNEFMTNRCE
ncbi:hypothetical protein J6590_078133 [Homalodisca vitripennis]|nr:hypothetical protein J6590_078133 [Homalodisca vitripennis]